MKYGIHTLDDFAWGGKTVLCRVDINAPLDNETGGLRDITRLKGCAPTVRELAEAGARVVLLAHQGGDLEYHNYASTEPHAAVMSELTGREVGFIDDVCGPAAREAVGRLADGDVLLLDNVRFCGEELTLFERKLDLSPEDQAKTLVVRKLAPLADLYVCDAFAAAHRSQPTLVGFEQLLPSAMGRLFEREYENLARLREEPARPCVFVLGGTKIQEAFPMMAAALRDGVRRHGAHRRPGRQRDAGGERRRHRRAVPGVHPGEPAGAVHRRVEGDPRRARRQGSCCRPTSPCVRDGARVEVAASDLPVDEQLVDLGHATAADVRRAHRRRRHRLRQRPGRGVRAARDRVRHAGPLGGDGRLAPPSAPLGGGDSVAAMNRFGLADRFDYVCTAGGRHGAVPLRQADAGRRSAQGVGRALRLTVRERRA